MCFNILGFFNGEFNQVEGEMRKTKGVAVVLLVMLAMSGCAAMTQQEKNTMYELQSYGVSSSDVAVKNPGIAAALNILPGIGNFYLANGTMETDQWTIGALNLLTWPLSILWGIPGAASDATIINKKETVRYYTYTPQGQKKLRELKEQYKQ
jgi:uncharacterized protein YceK